MAKHTAMFSPLCQATHGKLIAGKCPWCGRAVINGRALENVPCLAFAIAAGLRPAEEELRPRDESTDSLLAIIELIDCGAARAVPLLVAALRDPDESVREAAANALGRIGANAKDALPSLFILLDDEDTLVRDAAQEAITRIEAAT